MMGRMVPTTAAAKDLLREISDASAKAVSARERSVLDRLYGYAEVTLTAIEKELSPGYVEPTAYLAVDPESGTQWGLTQHTTRRLADRQ